MSVSVLRPPAAKATAAAIGIALLILPSLVWVLVDQQVWPWDPGFYGYWSVRMTRDGQSFGEWLFLTFNALKYMPPLLVWAGQVFVPLRHLTGDVESALMLLILVAGTGTLIVLYLTAYRIAENQGAAPWARIATGLAAAGVCGSASLFIGLSHQYFTEIPQTLAAAASVAVALGAERRPLLRNAALILFMVAFAFLVKATSLVFVLPALTYMAVAMTLARPAIPPRTEKKDFLWLVLAAAALAAAVTWYAINWEYMAIHFTQATVGAEVLNYAAVTPIPVRLRYWIGSAADVLSPTRFFAVFLLAAAIAAIATALWRLRGSARILRASVDSGAVFGLYLAGMVTLSIFSYALQINEDPRFLAPLIPVMAALAGWALATLRRPAVTVLVIAACAANAAVLHASSLGIGTPLVFRWLPVMNSATAEKETLTQVVAASCPGLDEMPPNLLGVSYALANPNTANFYAMKHHLETGKICYFAELPPGTVEQALAWLDTREVPYVVTVTPELQDPSNFSNLISKEFAAAIAVDPRFERTPDTISRFVIYRRVTSPN